MGVRPSGIVKAALPLRTLCYIINNMNFVQLAGLIAGVLLIVGCETTETTGTGNQEQKRLAQIQRQQAEAAQYDESDINLWNAHQDRLMQGTNPALTYTPLAQH